MIETPPATTTSFYIEVNPKGGGYKSIQTALWSAIPPFAIITGRNGSGKTQFLELLAYYFTGTYPPQKTALGVQVRVEGFQIDADEVGFVPSSGRFAGGGGASIAQMQNTRRSLVSTGPK